MSAQPEASQPTASHWHDVLLARMLQAGATDAELITELRRQRDAYRMMVKDAWKIIAQHRPLLTQSGAGFVECVRKAVAPGGGVFDGVNPDGVSLDVPHQSTHSVATPTALYHWSPSGRRSQILRVGIVPGSRPTVQSAPAPFTCWSDSPALAWALSGMSHGAGTGWDLWMAWLPEGATPIDDHRPCEFRVFEALSPARIWYVGSRTLCTTCE